MLFSITAYSITAGANTIDISSGVTSSVVLFLSKAYSLMILNNPSISSNVLMSVS